MFMTCPKCGSNYERHPLTSAAQALCPACRNEASWDEIKTVLDAASGVVPGGGAEPYPVLTRRVSPRPGSDLAGSGLSLSLARPSFFGSSSLVGRLVQDPFAPRVPVSELARAAETPLDFTDETAGTAGPGDAAGTTAASGATLAVPVPIRLAPEQPEIRLAPVTGERPALPRTAPKAALPVALSAGLLTSKPASSPLGVQVPEPCG